MSADELVIAADVAMPASEDATPLGKPRDDKAVGIALGGSDAIEEIAVTGTFCEARAPES